MLDDVFSCCDVFSRRLATTAYATMPIGNAKRCVFTSFSDTACYMKPFGDAKRRVCTLFSNNFGLCGQECLTGLCKFVFQVHPKGLVFLYENVRLEHVFAQMAPGGVCGPKE